VENSNRRILSGVYSNLIKPLDTAQILGALGKDGISAGQNHLLVDNFQILVGMGDGKDINCLVQTKTIT
jgi:hypothetical protein